VDIGFRYGGDEFTVILPEADDQQAYAIAERVRETFEEKRLDRLTLSIGVMSYREGYSLKSFIQYADSKMYEAKRAGGNRVYFYDTGHLTGEETAAQEEDG
jgi:diguanylate cyclase